MDGCRSLRNSLADCAVSSKQRKGTTSTIPVVLRGVVPVRFWLFGPHTRSATFAGQPRVHRCLQAVEVVKVAVEVQQIVHALLRVDRHARIGRGAVEIAAGANQIGHGQITLVAPVVSHFPSSTPAMADDGFLLTRRADGKE
jgi:hypothetical protein